MHQKKTIPKKLKTVYLSIGSNVGDSEENINRALSLLSKKGKLQKVSWIYKTKPYGVTDQPNFLNLVVKYKTKLGPFDLIDLIKKIEKVVGRTETYRWGPRVVDIDIVFYGRLRLYSPALQIPHKDLKNRDFVIRPLLDIHPDKETFQILLNKIPDHKLTILKPQHAPKK